MLANRILAIGVIGAAHVMCSIREGQAGNAPDAIFEKPRPIVMAELAKLRIHGVRAVEVSDYAPGHYTGELKPSPPHADHNPKKAIFIVWEKSPQRFVFSHEG